MPAVRAFTKIGLTGGAIDGVATDTAERRFSARVFEKRVVPTVVKNPKSQKQRGDEKAEGSRCGDEVHGDKLYSQRLPQKDKSLSATPPGSAGILPANIRRRAQLVAN